MSQSDQRGDAVIVLSQLSKVYEPTPRWMRVFARSHLTENVRALDGVDLSVGAGSICAIVGPNGAGKTTMFRIIMGLTTATSGTAKVLGLDAEGDSERIRQVVGWMPAEDRSLLMRATCRENLQMHGRLQGMPRKLLAERIDHVMEQVNLIPQMQSVVAGLSAGMKARLRLARALLPGPRALILDEPTGAVDPIAAHGLLELITSLVAQEQLAVLISSHRLEEIEALQSHALLMDRGRVKYDGDLDALRSEWDRPSLELVAADPASAGLIADDLRARGLDVTTEDLSVRVQLDGKHRVGAVLAGLGPLADSVEHVREIPMPLRDLIAQVYTTGTKAEATR
ncbi:ABC transporter ATP-binding protein [Actinoplanes sp. NPDC023714]|uniref:ABC transporter ATP-binding protein n=1 Tax=Actinoplanes sp. NPDC023714 TaxID=3154322 RepID=UPI0033F3BE07